MAWNKATAVEYSIAHANNVSLGRCAEYTREAIEAGGIVLARHEEAKDYGSSLIVAGFLPLLYCPVAYLAGDVVVINGFTGHPHGHMAMYSGRQWISDFAQRDLYPGPAYRVAQPLYVVYRSMP